MNVGVACLELDKLGDRLSESVYFLEGWPQGELDNKLTRAAKKELDPARRPVRPPREEEREVDAVIFQPGREVQGVRLVEAVAVQQHGAVEAVGDGHVRRFLVL